MVAIFKAGSSLKTTLNYNENKVKKGVAACIHAENYPMNHDEMQFHHKLNRLLNQAELNKNVKANSVHISLNFDPSERLPDERLREIANAYMEQIGFGEQPYLVYRHEDAGHPHIHIVSVKVDASGKRIDTQNIGKNQSEKARKNIEETFGLVRAEDSRNKEKYKLEAVSAAKVQYGRSETKRAISNVLFHVLNSYKYSSFHELNALLKLYNIMADRGSEGSRMYQGKGLMFRVLDDQGNKIGAPIKASQFYMKPTLDKLEELFAKNEPLKLPLRSRVKNTIDRAFWGNNRLKLEGLVKTLEKEGIHTVLRQNEQGRIYGITYIDHKNKVVFNGSDLGKAYSAKAILERCSQQSQAEIQFPSKRQDKLPAGKDMAADTTAGEPQVTNENIPAEKDLLEILLQPEDTYLPVPFQLKKTRKKKKRKRLSDNN